MTLTDADLDRVERQDRKYIGNKALVDNGDLNLLIAEIRRLRAAQITTLVACSHCGHGQRPRDMVDGQLCVTCAGNELRRLRDFLQLIVEEVDKGRSVNVRGVAVHALHNAADVPREQE